jgi:hypothetical protein
MQVITRESQFVICPMKHQTQGHPFFVVGNLAKKKEKMSHMDTDEIEREKQEIDI